MNHHILDENMDTKLNLNREYISDECGLSENATSENPKIHEFGLQLKEWLYSDPEYAHRLRHEGSANW